MYLNKVRQRTPCNNPRKIGWCSGSVCMVVTMAVVQSLSSVWLFVTPWTAAHQAFLSFTISQSLHKLMSIESVMPSNHLILLSPPSSLTLSLFQHQGLLQWVSSSYQVAEVLELQHQSSQWIFRLDFPLGLTSLLKTQLYRCDRELKRQLIF